ncbi:MAG: ABC transporter ATP-binding protein/permease [Gemmatimonadota bacterium]|nr:ABC transporter ATP-binding protein/permease [Gemmatimonadota bacterium]
MRFFYQPRDRRGNPLPPVRERLAAFRYIPPFLRMVWATKPSYGVGIVVLRTINAFLPLAMLWVGKLIIDGVVANVGAANPDWTLLAQYIGLELGLALVSDILGRLTSLLESLLGDLFSNEMSVRLMKHASTLDLQHFEDPEFFDKMQRARRQTMGRIALMSQTLTMGQQSLTLLSLLTALVAFNPWLLLILVVAILPSFLGETAYAGIAYSFMFQWTPQRRELDYYRWVASEVEPAKEIKLFGLSDHFIGKYSDLADEYVQENRRVATHRAATGGVLTSLSTLAYYGAVATIVYEAVIGAITIGSLTFLMGTFQRSRGLISSILMTIARAYEQGLQLKDLFDFLAVRPQIKNVENPLRLPDPVRSGFVFDDVGFQYPDADGWAVRHVSFEILPGERVALVGENGAGKTTLVKLLTRLYEPTEGRILLDGVDLAEYDLFELRQAIGVIFQDFFRYDLTARENIAVGRIERREDTDRIVDSAEKSMAADVIEHLDQKYDQMLGRRFEGGANLSGGEWQKIALGRAYMRDAQLLVLDEPTAALDARAEHQVFQRFTELTQGKMAVLISHRFSTVRMADRIVVLDEGRVLEDGSHEELLDLDGRYAELFNLQAEGYR